MSEEEDPAAAAAPVGQDGPAEQSAAARKPEESDADYFPNLQKAKQLRPNQVVAAASLPDPKYLKTALQRGGSAAGGVEKIAVACEAGCLGSLRLLCKYSGPSGPEEEERAQKFVAMAADSGRAEVVHYLVHQSRLGDVNRTLGQDEMSPLHIGAKDGNLEIVRELVNCPETDPDLQDSFGNTALHEAVFQESLEIVNCLLQAPFRRPALERPNKEGWTPMHAAAYQGNIEIVGALKSAGASIEKAAGGTAWTPLMLSILRGRCETARQVIAWGADPTAPGQGGDTPLMLAVRQVHHDIVDMLLAIEPVVRNVDMPNDEGCTALHFAAENNDSRTVRLLLAVGASPQPRTNNGETPIEMARAIRFGVCDLEEENMYNQVGEEEVLSLLQLEEITRLVMLRSKCRQQKRFEQADQVRGELRLRGVVIDVEQNKWRLPNGQWGWLSSERELAMMQVGNPMVA